MKSLNLVHNQGRLFPNPEISQRLTWTKQRLWQANSQKAQANRTSQKLSVGILVIKILEQRT